MISTVGIPRCVRGETGRTCYLWTERHDGFQRAVQRALWFARVTTRAVGMWNYFGSANPPNKELRADHVCMHYHGMGRHPFINVAVVEPASPAMTGGARSSAEHAGVTAALRAQKKHRKYWEMCLRIDSSFRDGVIERYEHCGDVVLWGLCSSLRVRGIGNRGRRTPTILPHDFIVGDAHGIVRSVRRGAVMSDAAMLERRCTRVGCVG
jgi:hypothetical protein